MIDIKNLKLQTLKYLKYALAKQHHLLRYKYFKIASTQITEVRVSKT